PPSSATTSVCAQCSCPRSCTDHAAIRLLRIALKTRSGRRSGFFVAGPPKAKAPPRGTATRAAAERGGKEAATPGRPKQGRPPRGAATRAAVERGGKKAAAPGRPKQGQPPRGGSDPRSGGAWG